MSAKCNILSIPSDMINLLISTYGAVDLFGTNKSLSAAVSAYVANIVLSYNHDFAPQIRSPTYNSGKHVFIFGPSIVDLTVTIGNYSCIGPNYTICSMGFILTRGAVRKRVTFHLSTKTDALMIHTDGGQICMSCGVCRPKAGKIYQLTSARSPVQTCPHLHNGTDRISRLWCDISDPSDGRIRTPLNNILQHANAHESHVQGLLFTAITRHYITKRYSAAMPVITMLAKIYSNPRRAIDLLLDEFPRADGTPRRPFIKTREMRERLRQMTIVI